MEPMENKTNRIFCFDLIRAFSCLCIMVVHFNASVSGWVNGQFLYPNSLVPNYYLGGQVYLGGIGVSLFFMLSGTTLMMHYHGGWKNFYLKRFKSIYPMFWIAYAIVAMFDLMFSGSVGAIDLRLFPLTVAGMDGYLATLGVVPYGFYKIGEWFLGCIVLLYLLFPIVYQCVKRFPAATAIGSVVLAVALSRLCKHFGYQCSGLEPWFKLPEMVLGMLLAKCHIEKNSRLAFLLAIVSGMSVVVLQVLQVSINSLVLCTLTCLFLFTTLVLLSGLVKNRNVRTVVSCFAGLSYPIFLTHHWIIGKMVQRFHLETMARRDVLALFVTYVVVTCIASSVLKRVESGIRRTFAK